jgi:cytochrome c biogenesis protein CcmG/thiol:disulfide interchange protein DsbE
MRKPLLIVVVILLALAVYEFSKHRSNSMPGGAAAIHAVAPNFSLQDMDGQPLNLASYKGKVVLLDFWATWCAPCRDEIPHFVEFQKSYGAQGLQIIGISMDDGPKPVREFYQQFKMNYPVAMGTTQLAQSYGGILGLPVTFLIGRDGRIVAKYVGATEMPPLGKQIKSQLQSQ